MQKFSLLVFCLVLAACGGSSTTTTTTTATTGLRLVSAGDFESSASASLSALVRTVTTETCADVPDLVGDQFDPALADGSDCDEDGGVVAHITPTSYSLAIKRASLFSDDADTADLDLVADTGTLGNSELIDFTPTASSDTVVTIDPADLTAGIYDGIEIEMYYFQMTFEIGGVTRNVRIYMSDDDFDGEAATRSGLGPHHQGDITFIDDDGTTELGWIDFTWSDTLVSERGADQNGAGLVDDETGHDRGFFGDRDFWGNDLFVQGANQDIYLNQLRFDTSLTIDPETMTGLTTITATFSIADTFFYEDFDPIGTGFSGGDGSDAVNPDGGWAPLEPTATLSVE